MPALLHRVNELDLPALLRGEKATREMQGSERSGSLRSLSDLEGNCIAQGQKLQRNLADASGRRSTIPRGDEYLQSVGAADAAIATIEAKIIDNKAKLKAVQEQMGTLQRQPLATPETCEIGERTLMKVAREGGSWSENYVPRPARKPIKGDWLKAIADINFESETAALKRVAAENCFQDREEITALHLAACAHRAGRAEMTLRRNFLNRGEDGHYPTDDPFDTGAFVYRLGIEAIHYFCRDQIEQLGLEKITEAYEADPLVATMTAATRAAEIERQRRLWLLSQRELEATARAAQAAGVTCAGSLDFRAHYEIAIADDPDDRDPEDAAPVHRNERIKMVE